jgi:hypothetical protein
MAHANLSRRLGGQRLLLHGSSNERQLSQPKQRRQGRRLGRLEGSLCRSKVASIERPDTGPRVIPAPSRSFVASHGIEEGIGWSLIGRSPTPCFPVALFPRDDSALLAQRCTQRRFGRPAFIHLVD